MEWLNQPINLLCISKQNACCSVSYSGTRSGLGDWFFPNGARVTSNDNQWDFFQTRGQMVVLISIRVGQNGI